MECVMTLEILPPAFQPRGRSAALQRKIDDALARYHRKHRGVIKAEAVKHPALADLALSFPALLFVIAVPHKGVDAEALRRAVIAGEPLKALARRAGLPIWLRQLKPQAFADKLAHVPRGDLVARQIANFIPRKSKDQACWLKRTSNACHWGHEGFALWASKTRPVHPNHEPESTFAMLALWAWYSEHPETELGRLVQKRWRMSTDWKTAVRHCKCWIESVNLHLDMQMEQRPPKCKERSVAGYDFIHLANSDMLADEAVAMRNCIKTYGYDIANWDCELWSMRKDGKRIASLCIGNSGVDGLPSIIEIKLAGNRRVTPEVALAARRWFEMHDVESISIAERHLPPDSRRRTWQRGFKPYWLEKRMIPWWLPLSGDLVLREI
jgi:hypothetical protein